TCADLHLGIDVVLGFHRTAAKTAEASATPAGGLVSVIIMRNGTQDNGVHSEHFAQLGGGDRISAVAVGEVLLRQEFIDGIALDYAHVAVLHQFSDQEVGGSFSEIGRVHLDKGQLHATLDGGIIEVKNGYTLFWTLAPSWHRSEGQYRCPHDYAHPRTSRPSVECWQWRRQQFGCFPNHHFSHFYPENALLRYRLTARET